MVAFEAALIEVACANAGLWTWRGAGVFGVPFIGILGWGCFACGVLAALEFLPGRKLALAPLLGFATTHGLLQILWRAGFKRISYTPVPEGVLIGGMIFLGAVFSYYALRARRDMRISLVEIFPAPACRADHVLHRLRRRSPRRALDLRAALRAALLDAAGLRLGDGRRTRPRVARAGDDGKATGRRGDAGR
ncbi:MAG: hypothetical protein M5R36_26920 [Deltaproteobacteria bacterium]|nr:hypothetical protein [Deltaproteobacteria bacterium]